MLATWKVLISLGLAPILYASYAMIAIVIAMKSGIQFGWIIWIPILTTIVLPIMNYAALKFGEAGMDILKYVRGGVSRRPCSSRILDLYPH